MNSKRTNLQFTINDFVPFIDGLDICVNFSIIIFLSSFLLGTYDTRFATIILSSVLILSYVVRIFDLQFSKLIKNSKIKNVNIFLILFFIYLIPLGIQEGFPIIFSIFIFLLVRALLGIFLSLSNRNLLVNNQSLLSNKLDLKYWIIFSLGLSVGSFLHLLVNETFSNEFLNKGGWKIMYVVVSLIILFVYILCRSVLKKDVRFDFSSHANQYNNSLRELSKSFIVFIPLTCFFLFSLSNWLPKFSNPENLYFLNYSFLNLFITILILFFITPLAKLVGIRRSMIFFNLSIFMIAFVLSFLTHSSSYSIDFLKFFLSLVSSFTLCHFILYLESKKDNDLMSVSRLNLIMSISALFFPFLLYYSIYFVINYSVIYIFLSIVYFINYILIKKNG